MAYVDSPLQQTVDVLAPPLYEVPSSEHLTASFIATGLANGDFREV